MRLVFINQLLETGFPFKCWFMSNSNNHAADEVGELVQVAQAGDAIFLPAVKWDLLVQAACV